MTTHCTGVQPIIVEVPAGTPCSTCGKVLPKDLRMRLGRAQPKGRNRWRLTPRTTNAERLKSLGALARESAEWLSQTWYAENYIFVCSSACAKSVKAAHAFTTLISKD